MSKKEIEFVVSYDVKTGKTTRYDNRFDAVRELVKDPSLRVTEIAWKTGYNKGHVSRLRKEAIRQALETEQEPVGWMHNFIEGNVITHIPADIGRHPERWTALYTAPPKREWVGLTDDEVSEIIDREIGFNSCWGPEEAFARAIESKLKERNT